MIVCTFFTTGTPYQAEAEALRRSVEAQGLKCEVYERPHPGSWLAAQCLTPGVIEQCLYQNGGAPVLFMDADARLEARPTLLFDWYREGRADVGVYLLANGGKYAVPPGGPTLCSGTSWWTHKPDTLQVLREWRRVAERWCERTQHRGSDQLALYGVMQHHPDLRWGILPPEYCWIEGISEERFPEAAGQVVVRHHQKSREWKAVVDGIKPTAALREVGAESVP